jgi:NitT/TauT family transport system substrate-binding protein
MNASIGKMAGLIGATMLLATGAAFAQEKPVKVISSLPTMTSAATYLMVARDYDKAHGLDVEVTQAGGSSSLQIDAVLAGSAMFGHPGTATAMQAIREGADLKIIAAGSNNQIAAVISNAALAKSGVAVDAPIADRFKALKGLTIGTNPVGATYTQMFRYYLKQFGLDPDKDVTLVGMQDTTALISGIEQGRFDAIVSASGVVEQALTLAPSKIWFAAPRGDIPGGESSVVVVVVATGDTVEKHPDMVKAYRAAMGDALKAINEDHDKTGQALQAAHFQKMNPEVWKAVWDNATAAFPTSVTFSKEAFDFWIGIDPKGPDSFKAVDYSKIVIPEAQSK